MRQTKPTKKKILLIGAGVLALLIAALATVELLMNGGGKDEPSYTLITGTRRPVELEEPDYDFDIFTDEEWLDEDRLIHYSNGTEGTVITRQHNEQGAVGELFLAYFDALMQGDAEAYAALFTSSYRENNTLPDYFTMQRVYNISVTEAGSYTFTEGQYAGYTRQLFRVQYAILKNDGTFRDDLQSGYTCSVTFELLSDGTAVRINGIETVQQAIT